jgi:hypothetical protein
LENKRAEKVLPRSKEGTMGERREVWVKGGVGEGGKGGPKNVYTYE